MFREESGQITVYLALIFFVSMGLAFCVLEGMRSYMESALAEDAFQGAGNYVLSYYDKALYQNYHVFFMDPRERGQIVSDGESYVDGYLSEKSYFDLDCRELAVTEEKTAVDEDGLYLKHQIREWMKYRESARARQKWRKLFEASEKSRAEAETIEKDMGEAQKAIDEASSSEDSKEKENLPVASEAAKEQQALSKRRGMQWKEIKDTFTQIMDAGILFYVIDNTEEVSGLSISSEALPSGKKASEKKGFLEGGLSFSSVEGWKNLLSSVKEELPEINLSVDDYYILRYISEYFRRYGNEKEGKSGLRYETEYLIGGEVEDKENLKAVANRIFGLRFASDYAYLSGDSEWKATSAAISGALTGVLGFPQAQKAVQVLLTASMSLGEALLDVHAIFSGQKVPLYKSKDTWNVTFDNIAVLLKNKGPVKTGGKGSAGYEEYLNLLLAVGKSSERRLFRMMDIMQVNTALEEPGFLMEDSLFSFRWEGKIKSSRWFSVMPATGVRGDQSFTIELSRNYSY